MGGVDEDNITACDRTNFAILRSVVGVSDARDTRERARLK